MSRFELCENSDKKQLPLMLMNQCRVISISTCTMALRNKGEESVRKKEEKSRTQTRTRRVESRTTTTYACAVGAWDAAYPQQLPKGQTAGYYPVWQRPP